jgi:FixJ family two-component response regulator
MTESAPTIFIIDDDASVRKGLSRLLDSLGFSTETFASAEEFLKRSHYDGVGCIVLDVRMPGLSGMDLQDELNKADYSMPIIFITGHGNIPMSVQAMKKGAVDFLPKPFDEDQLLDALRKAIEKDTQAKAKRAEARDILGRITQLTPREYEIFRYVITGMLNKQIASKLDIAEKTVKIHRSRMMEKLGVGSVAELVRVAEKARIEPADKPVNQ